jgi:DNA polymerase I-like protein with 3'-5' exonuclease and polymerase domains
MNILLIVPSMDRPYTGKLQTIVDGAKVIIYSGKVPTLGHVSMLISKAKDKGIEIDSIATSSVELLRALIRSSFSEDKKEVNTTYNYEGAMFNYYCSLVKKEIPCLILPSMRTMITKAHGEFLMRRYFLKLTDPKFPSAPELKWSIISAQESAQEVLKAEFNSAMIIAVDIETNSEPIHSSWFTEQYCAGASLEGIALVVNKRNDKGTKTKKRQLVVPKITMVGYSLLLEDSKGKLYSKTYVLPIKTMEDIYLMRMLNNSVPPKIMHNGRYDSMYFLRYNAPLFNYTCDTYALFHSWYVELPRPLFAVSAFFVKNHMFWKDEGANGMEEYNAKDCHQTLWAWVFAMQEIPEWVMNNYRENFPMVFPAIHCGIEGFKVDFDDLNTAKAKLDIKLIELEERLDYLVGIHNFNAGSSAQVKKLMLGMGYAAEGTDDKTIEDFKFHNPVYDIIGDLIQEIRGVRKALSSYYNINYYSGRLLFELDNCGTDTGRFASKESSFWCGTQVQNMPPYARTSYIADDGWVLNAADNSQSESRTTAYISEDLNLIDAVETAKDFHNRNASGFFGIPEEEITKMLRTLGKKIGHGANYNMGWFVLMQTMGKKLMLEAKKLLNLPHNYGFKAIGLHLLGLFDKTYPRVRNEYYQEVIHEIATTKKLVGATGWTRYCFGNPSGSKASLNSYVAHGPQSLSVKMINKAFFKIWKHLQIGESKIRLKAQIHDEIMYMSRPEDKEYCRDIIAGYMSEPIEIKGRVLSIPNKPVIGKQRWSELEH